MDGFFWVALGVTNGVSTVGVDTGSFFFRLGTFFTCGVGAGAKGSVVAKESKDVAGMCEVIRLTVGASAGDTEGTTFNIVCTVVLARFLGGEVSETFLVFLVLGNVVGGTGGTDELIQNTHAYKEHTRAKRDGAKRDGARRSESRR